MEEEMIHHTNSTLEASVANWVYVLIDIIATITSVLGLVADALIIYVILKNKSMRTRTNVFIANWAIIDVIAIFAEPVLPRFFLDYDGVPRLILFHATNVFPACSLMIVLMLHANIPAKTMCCLVYTFISAVFTIAIITSTNDSFSSTQFFLLFALVLLLICSSIIADVANSCRNNDLGADGEFKLGLLRLQYCCQTVFIGVFSVDLALESLVVIELLTCLFPLVAVVTLVFVYKHDIKMKCCIDQIFVCLGDSNIDDDINVFVESNALPG